jgi:hypothetical protein
MESQYYFLPIVPQYSGAYPIVSLEGAMDGDRLIPLGKLGPLSDVMTRYAAKGGVVTDNRERAGILVQQRDGTFALTTTPQAQRKIEHAVTGILALELDASGTVKDCYLADRPHAYEKMTKIAEVRFQKRLETEREKKPMTLEQALQKVYAQPQSVRDGFFRKDIAVSPGAYAKPVDELNPPAKTPGRTPTAPKGTINVSELAHANDKIRVIGEHLQAAQQKNPGSRQISDAGMSWYAITTLGLGIDSRYMDGAQTVPVTPNNEALAEAWAHSTGDKAAGGFLDFRKAITKTRQAPNVMSRNRSEISSRPIFSKSASESNESGSEAAQLLRRHSLETGLAHMRILQDKIKAAMEAVGPDSMAQPHLSSAHIASVAAMGHLQRTLDNEDED